MPYPVEASGGEYRFVQATQRDAAGIFWLGTMKGLLRLDPRTNAWQHYQNIPSDTTSLAADVIFCLLGSLLVLRATRGRDLLPATA